MSDKFNIRPLLSESATLLAIANSGEMTPRERHNGEALIKAIQAAIEGSDPAIASSALISVLATLVGACAADPKAQAQHLGTLLVDAVGKPPRADSLN